MSSGSSKQDVPFLLFLVPFAVSGIYALYLWVTSGISAILPSGVFLQVTESPYVFLVGFVAVMVAAALDIQYTDPANRRTKLIQESGTLQKVAVAALVLGVICAWYAAGFDLGGAAANVAAGRYVVVFPGLVILFSFLILPSVSVKREQLRNIAIVLLLLAVPLSVDEVGKRNFFAGMGLGVALFAVALYLYFTSRRGR
ncbi:MAG: hypothetical protein JRN09_06085 [Nitrososphaerota archaeon]|jgi:hypothetical protein|nr:hypothetical protein [Nitrososphaerota archaeon]